MNVTYAEVALRAILPAVLYFTGIFVAVHLEAKKLGLKGIPRNELPKFSKLLSKIYLLLPLVVLVWLVTTGTRTLAYSATIAILVAIVVRIIDRDAPITFGRLLEAVSYTHLAVYKRQVEGILIFQRKEICDPMDIKI